VVEKAQMNTIEAIIASLLILSSLYFFMSFQNPQISQESNELEEQLRDYGISILNAMDTQYGLNHSSITFLQKTLGNWSEDERINLKNRIEELLPENVKFDVILIFESNNGIKAVEVIDGGSPHDFVIVEKSIWLKDEMVKNPLVIGGEEVRNLNGDYYNVILLRMVMWYA
jgi:hypothetical protein